MQRRELTMHLSGAAAGPVRKELTGIASRLLIPVNPVRRIGH